MNSAAKHKKTGRKEQRARQPSMLPNIILFLQIRGMYSPGKKPLNFRQKKAVDKKDAA